jgi:hypothetical protein
MQRTIRPRRNFHETFATLSAAKAWRQDALPELRKGTMPGTGSVEDGNVTLIVERHWPRESEPPKEPKSQAA